MTSPSRGGGLDRGPGAGKAPPPARPIHNGRSPVTTDGQARQYAPAAPIGVCRASGRRCVRMIVKLETTPSLCESCDILATRKRVRAMTGPSISRDMKSSSIRIATGTPPLEEVREPWASDLGPAELWYLSTSNGTMHPWRLTSRIPRRNASRPRSLH